MGPGAPPDQLLSDLLRFVHDEQLAGQRKLLAVWERPIAWKLQRGWSQRILRLERTDDPSTLWARIDGGESRFREGDLLMLHAGDPLDQALGRGLTLEADMEDRWLLRSHRADAVLRACSDGPCYADPDAIDLTVFHEQAIEEISTSWIGREIVLPLLGGSLDITFSGEAMTRGEDAARARGFNTRQAQAVGLALGADQIACIQGPPGTGKSSVLALIARLMVEDGERVLVTSHTHMAINNALNKIREEGVPAIKVGLHAQRKGLRDEVPCHAGFADWHERPSAGGYVIGATPFATCTSRLEHCEFDTILFDEASQITVPLALMAMRKGRRFVFVGDQQQLPPVMLSRSVLDESGMSAFAALTARHADHAVMLQETYRMNRWLTAWPSRAYYRGELSAAGANRERRMSLPDLAEPYAAVFDPAAPGVFIPTRDRTARTRNDRDAQLVAQLCKAAIAGGLPPREIGIVTPYRAQGRAVRSWLNEVLGRAVAREVVADTVERMQGQERELVILTLATGDEVFLGAVAEFFFQPQRLNVSITRAKTKLVVIGPEIDEVPVLGHEDIRRWVGAYADLLRHLQRIPL
ncbi:AAA family ATPase [Aquincola sp. S2]|uniref:AAA family ATPase n=1 Tax=Pseudaquabacterium terrae TaxID=2732868 RepID=A0ABX2EFJ7_9BURK|nr:AAA domain-containing protein [Aquabacterium terrae]NRF67392.1 AAA family ATPase [Aquabacterium terrae]